MYDVIGVFDSGIGGLGVLRELRRTLPEADFVYVADQARAPYGTQSLEDVAIASEDITGYLISLGADTIVVACNTASAAALNRLRALHPGIHFVGMEPAVKPAALATTSGVIGVLATAATFQGELFESVVDRFANGTKVLSAACPEWVDAVEAGWLNGSAIEALVRQRVEPMLEQGADCLVLGCTHFPFLADMIRQVAGEKVAVIDPAPAVAKQAHRLTNSHRGSASVSFTTTGDARMFEHQVRRLAGAPANLLAWAGHGNRHLV